MVRQEGAHAALPVAQMARFVEGRIVRVHLALGIVIRQRSSSREVVGNRALQEVYYRR